MTNLPFLFAHRYIGWQLFADPKYLAYVQAHWLNASDGTIRILGAAENSIRNLYTTRGPVKTPADLGTYDIKMRGPLARRISRVSVCLPDRVGEQHVHPRRQPRPGRQLSGAPLRCQAASRAFHPDSWHPALLSVVSGSLWLSLRGHGASVISLSGTFESFLPRLSLTTGGR
jgi:hypothetical protein